VGDVGLELTPGLLYDADEAESVSGVIRNIKKLNEYGAETQIIRKDGTRLDVFQQLFAIRTPSGAFDGVGIILQNISAVRQAERDSSRNTQRLNLALEASGGGVWQADIKKRIFYYDTRTAEIFGLNRDADRCAVTELIRAVDKGAGGDFAKKAISAVRSNAYDGIFDGELQITAPDGRRRYISTSTSCQYDENNEAETLAGMSFDNTAMVELREQLIAAKNTAEEANRAKSQFLSNMSHEIRTPMNAIMGMTRLAKSSSDIEKIRSCLTKIDNSSTHLLNIINDILDLSKIEWGKFELYNETFEVEKVLSDFVQLIGSKTAEKKQELFVKIDNGLPKVLFGDSTRYLQVIMNLVSNAVKFTPEGGKISLRVGVKEIIGNKATIVSTVTDTGIGLTAEQQSRLFKSFEQADNSISKRFGGTGLGLAISKHIVEMLNGEIGVESQINVGSKFEFTVKFDTVGSGIITEDMQIGDNTLQAFVVDDSAEVREYVEGILTSLCVPCRTFASGAEIIEYYRRTVIPPVPHIVFMDYAMSGMNGLEAARKLKETDGGADSIMIMMLSMYELEPRRAEIEAEGIKILLPKPIFPSNISGIIDGVLGKKAAAAKTEADKPDFSGNSVLVVEDIEINAEILASILEEYKISYETASDGKIAHEMYCKNPAKYDLILMDIQMPNLDGYSATKLIRASDYGTAKTVPIVAMTANAFSSDVDQALKAGMNEHISKPIDPSRVDAVLKKYLRVNAPGQRISKNNKENNNLEEDIMSLQGIDLQAALKILGGNTKLYVRLVGKFNEGMLTDLGTAISGGLPEDVQAKAHAIKGVGANLGFPNVQKLAAAVELKAKAGNVVPADDIDYIELITAYRIVLDSVATILANPEILNG
jgi:signal transduction histidine kinase/DNA-binding response OmpR family regulator